MNNTYIKGKYSRAIFKSDKGYIIGLLKVKETNQEELEDFIDKTITFTGYFHELNEEENYLFHGKLIEHEKYGEQFQVDSYERVIPEEKDSIVEFLSSGLFKGIGEKRAERIVSHLGKDTLKVILENPNNLLLIPTITKKNIITLHNTLVEYEASYKTIVRLNEIGFNTKDSLIIYNKYKTSTDTVIDNNIYTLMEDIEEITFKKLDAIALKTGIDKEDIRRVQAAILYILDEVCNLYGHSYLSEDEIYNYTVRCISRNIEETIFYDSLESLIIDLKIIKEEDRYYLAKMYEAESNITKRCGYLSRLSDNVDKKIENKLSDLEEMFECTYNDEQKQAILNSIQKSFLIVTGGPGTGKTTIIKAICELYKKTKKISHEQLSKEIALLAPTGRASKRICESTFLPATTIHRFLKWNKDNNKFGVNEYNKSDVKLVIIDEFSMVDTYLFDNLLKGLRFDTKIIIVGDYNQLPSVGPGQLLKDMIESDCLNVIELKQLYRQKENSNIISLAYQINEGKTDNDIFNKELDLTFIPVSSTNLKDRLLEISKEYKKLNDNFQILAPMYKTRNGIDSLNISLQDEFNKKSKTKKEIIINNVLFRENDKVIQLTNMPDENVFNGDIGYIQSIRNDLKKEVSINFDGNIVKYTAVNFNKFKHAYAISIHKSQGSEFDVVIIPITNEYGKMLYRKLIYTAVTRAKKKLYLIGEISALERSILTNNNDIRKTTLKEKLIENIKMV